MNQKKQFNAELYFANPEAWTLETRGGIKVDKVYDDPEPDYFHKYKYDGYSLWSYFVSDAGRLYENKESEYDLFMIEKQPLTTDIPFTLEDFKTWKYDVVSASGKQEKCLFAAIIDFMGVDIAVVWEHAGAIEYKPTEAEKELLLRPRPITPFTNPELYEVSDDEKEWYPIKKYYDEIKGADLPHKALMENDLTDSFWHLRLKDQPTVITQQQADEAIKKIYGKFKIEG